jgi:hypothetical protein
MTRRRNGYLITALNELASLTARCKDPECQPPELKPSGTQRKKNLLPASERKRKGQWRFVGDDLS